MLILLKEGSSGKQKHYIEKNNHYNNSHYNL